MTESQLHHRRSIRLKEYNYSEEGEYFITIVTQNRIHLFGEISSEEMRLSPIGQIVQEEWLKTPSIRHEIELGSYVIMPNHFHAIVHITNTEPSRGDRPVAPTKRPGLTKKSIGSLVAGFKSSATIRINRHRGLPGVPVWQRNYYEHIIMSDDEYGRIDAYINSNPANWLNDPEFS